MMSTMSMTQRVPPASAVPPLPSSAFLKTPKQLLTGQRGPRTWIGKAKRDGRGGMSQQLPGFRKSPRNRVAGARLSRRSRRGREPIKKGVPNPQGVMGVERCGGVGQKLLWCSSTSASPRPWMEASPLFLGHPRGQEL